MASEWDLASVVDGELVTSRLPARERRLRIAMVTSLRDRCGVADYSQRLVDALAPHVEVAWVTDPDGFSPAMNEADVVHIQHQYFLFGGVAPWRNAFGRLANRITAPIVMTVHEIVEPDGGMARRAAIRVTNRSQFVRPGIVQFIVHTEADLDRLATQGVSAERITVIPLGVPEPPRLPPRSAARRALGIEGQFILTVFGFVSRRKGHRTALEALALLPENCRLLIAGGRHPDDRSDYVDELKRVASDLGVGGRVSFTGYLEEEDVANIMSASDLILAPFVSGSGSASLALAFACGRPVLASAIPPNVEISKLCPGSLSLVPPGQPGELAEAVARLQRDPRTLARLAEGSRRYAARFTYAHMAELTAMVYRRAAGGTGR